jgi:hypothetical protein
MVKMTKITLDELKKRAKTLRICPLFNLIFKSDGSIQWTHMMMTTEKNQNILKLISKPGKKNDRSHVRFSVVIDK